MSQHPHHAQISLDTIATRCGRRQTAANRLKRSFGLERSFGLKHSFVPFSFAMLLLAGCGTMTIFQSSFSSNVVGAPPAHNQATGTIDVSGAPGSVVITPPLQGVSGNWAQISRAAGQTVPVSSMLCSIPAFQPGSSNSLLAVLLIPNASDMPPGSNLIASVGFNVVGPGGAEFLHLDFMQNNTVRVNDSTTVFGTFTRGQFFTLTVSMDVNITSAIAHMSITGGGASGSLDYNLPLGPADQFDAVNFYVGFPWSGWFQVQNILVTRK